MKQKISIPLDEQEFHINFCPSEMGKDCEIYTTIPWLMKNLEKMVEKYPEQCKLVKDDQYSYTVTVPFKLVKPRNPRVLTEKQKQQMAENMRKMRNND